MEGTWCTWLVCEAGRLPSKVEVPGSIRGGNFPLAQISDLGPILTLPTCTTPSIHQPAEIFSYCATINVLHI